MSLEVADTQFCAPNGSCSSCCCDKCCCTMPHGRVVLFPTITLTIAAILSLIVLLNCVFVRADEDSRYSWYVAGIWTRCVYSPYSSNIPIVGDSVHGDDPARKVAMSFALIACIVGTGTMIALWPITCKPYPMPLIYSIGGTVVFALISQLLTFSMLNTEYCQVFGCSLGWGGIMSTIAAVFWLIAAIGVFTLPKPIDAREAVGVIETVNVTENIQSDGTKVMEKTTISPDGTKTIERTVERQSNQVVGVEQPIHGGGHAVAQAVAMETEP